MVTDTLPTLWADQPYQLLEVPPTTRDGKAHSAYYMASEMAHAHNCLLRGLNAIVLQAPHIPDSTNPQYKEGEVRDLLKYTEVWVALVDHHHNTEETTMFPQIDQFANQPGLTSSLQDQHHAFYPGLERLGEYGRNTKPVDYRWEGESGMKRIIDGFATSMQQHLHDEVQMLLTLDGLEDRGLKKCFDETERVAKAQGNVAMLYDMFPMVLGCCDRTHNGGNAFPPLPKPIKYAIHYWFSRRHASVWRFNPSDYWGQPRPLQFLPRPTAQ